MEPNVQVQEPRHISGDPGIPHGMGDVDQFAAELGRGVGGRKFRRRRFHCRAQFGQHHVAGGKRPAGDPAAKVLDNVVAEAGWHSRKHSGVHRDSPRHRRGGGRKP